MPTKITLPNHPDDLIDLIDHHSRSRTSRTRHRRISCSAISARGM
jgi:hypothetical protein